MEPMKPMTPMQPMEAMSAEEPWWPADLGEPSSTGGQNGVRYAFFPGARRLLIDSNGQTSTYDSGDHQIGSVSQQDGGANSLTFSSQHGPVALDALRKVS